MNGKTLLLILGSLSLFSIIISTPFTNFAFGQVPSPTIGNNKLVVLLIVAQHI